MSAATARRTVRAAALAFLSLALAGCLAPAAEIAPASTLPADWAAQGEALFVEHDHTDREQHAEMAHGLAVKAFSTLSEDGLSLGEYAEADAAQGLIAVMFALTGKQGFALLERAALPDIKVLSVSWDEGSYGDVKLDDELALLYHAPGVDVAFYIWDVSDPTAPVRVGSAPGAGCHMVHPQRIGGATYVWCVTLPTTQLYRIEALPGGSYVGVPLSFAAPQSDPEVARYASYYADLTPLGPVALLGSHDMTAQEDPLTGAPILAVANELQGIRLFDVSRPEVPIEIGHWRGEGLDAPMERVHTVVLHKIGERRIAFAATETFTDVPPHFYFVDMTDLAAPVLLADWVPPGIEHDDGLRFSAHNLNVVGTRAYLANFHGGLWVLDVADPADPKVVAHRIGVHDTGFPEKGKIIIHDVATDTNGYWDVIVVDGYAIVTDMPSGIEVLAVEGDPHGDPAYSSVG